MTNFLDNFSSSHYSFDYTNSSTNCALFIYLMARITKCIKLFIHFVILTLISYFIKNQKPEIIVNKIVRYLPDIKHILMWTRVPGIEEDGQNHFIQNGCKQFNCYITVNRSFFTDLRYFDAVIFNAQAVSAQDTDLPSTRSIVQKYIFASNDSSHNYPVCSSVYENYFNWTWTYKPDSSIPYSFITVQNLHQENLGTDLNWIYDMAPVSDQFKSTLSSKTVAAAIYLDKCESHSKREYYLQQLQMELAKYNLSADVFGPCGTRKCGRSSLKPCFYRIRTTYYFYLALEDSISSDYVTQCVLWAYDNNAVPIVYGGAEYHRYLPPNSYIEGAKLGPAITAKLVYQAIQNKTTYYDYFRWKNHYVMKKSTILNACDICHFMNSEGWLKTRTRYINFRRWWNPFFEYQCRSADYF